MTNDENDNGSEIERNSRKMNNNKWKRHRYSNFSTKSTYKTSEEMELEKIEEEKEAMKQLMDAMFHE